MGTHCFVRSLSVWTVCAVAIAGVAAGDHPGDGVSTPVDPPTHHVVHGEPVPLDLDLDRVAILYVDGTTEADRASTLAAAAVEAESSTAIPIREWALVHLKEPLAGPRGGGATVAALAAAPHVLFASPLFVDDQGYWSAVTGEILLRFAPAHAADSAALLSLLAPDLEVV